MKVRIGSEEVHVGTRMQVEVMHVASFIRTEVAPEGVTQLNEGPTSCISLVNGRLNGGLVRQVGLDVLEDEVLAFVTQKALREIVMLLRAVGVAGRTDGKGRDIAMHRTTALKGKDEHFGRKGVAEPRRVKHA